MDRMGATASREAMMMPISQMLAVRSRAQVGSPLALPWPNTCHTTTKPSQRALAKQLCQVQRGHFWHDTVVTLTLQQGGGTTCAAKSMQPVTDA